MDKFTTRALLDHALQKEVAGPADPHVVFELADRINQSREE